MVRRDLERYREGQQDEDPELGGQGSVDGPQDGSPGTQQVVATLFIDRTHNNALLTKLKKEEVLMAEITGYRIELIEKMELNWSRCWSRGTLLRGGTVGGRSVWDVV